MYLLMMVERVVDGINRAKEENLLFRMTFMCHGRYISLRMLQRTALLCVLFRTKKKKINKNKKSFCIDLFSQHNEDTIFTDTTSP